MLTEYFEINGIFLRFFVLMRRSFPTIFRHFPTNESKSKASGLEPPFFRTTFCYSTTASLLHLTKLLSLLVSFVNTLFIFVRTVLTSVNIVLFYVSAELPSSIQCWSFKTIYGATNQVGIGLLYWPARLQRLAEFIPWNKFLGSLKV